MKANQCPLAYLTSGTLRESFYVSGLFWINWIEPDLIKLMELGRNSNSTFIKT